MTEFSLWLDADDAESQICARSSGDKQLETVATELVHRGFCILKGIADVNLIDNVVSDYKRFLSEHVDIADKHKDAFGRHFRLTNFHVYSDSAMRIAKDESIMRVLDFIFGARAMVYTSLAFEYSTEQRPHRDTPHFYTQPEGLFLGVWFPLEDVNPDAGPLTYYPGSHRISVSQLTFLDGKDPGDPNNRLTAISAYQEHLREASSSMSSLQSALLKKGDVAIWHPQLVHGGSRQKNGSLTRRSMVFHVAPETVPVFKDDVFFGMKPASLTPYRKEFSYGRYHAHREKPAFMNAR